MTGRSRFRARGRVAALCFWLAAPAELLSPAQRQRNIDSFEYVWRTIRDRHWDPQLGGLNWQAIHDELRPKIEQAGTMPKARAVIEAAIARLGQTHFAIIPAEVYRDMREGGGNREGTIGIDVRVPGAEALVTSVEQDSPAAQRGVHPGWQVLKIDGRKVALALTKITNAYRTSTQRDFRLASSVKSKLVGKVGDPVRITFRDGNDQTVELEIPRSRPRGSPATFGYLPLVYVWIESRKLDRQIGYLAFNLFMDPVHLMPAFEQAVTSCLHCDGMLIDLRGNPGGIGAMVTGMAGWFLDSPGHLGTMYTRETSIKFLVTPRPETYRGPLAILVDGCSGSSAEIFAGGLQDLKRARIFGSRTAGAALPSSIEMLPNGDGFQFAHANYLSGGGKPLEGMGVIPDVQVAPTREALLQGRDLVVEAAVQWIRAQKKDVRVQIGR